MLSSIQPRARTLFLPDERATARFGAALAPLLAPGCTVLLSGPLGAGKSALARAIVTTLLNDPAAEVPSPSYTLVNVYETPAGQIWHADLYRLAGAAGEIEELGLAEAMESALVLIEWPERLGGALPARHLAIALAAPASGGRSVEITAQGPGWDRVLELLEGWR